jgi:hypothetical protein
MISVSLSTSLEPKDHVRFKRWKTSCIESLCDFILNCSWSPSIFRNDYRNKNNFISADWLALDFDDGWPLTSAIGTCRANDLTHIIGTSKSHQREKHGDDICDRYRVVLKLSRRITRQEDFAATWYRAWVMFSRRADRAARDPSRFFFPCRDIVSVAEDLPLDVCAGSVCRKDIKRNIIKRATPTNIAIMLAGVKREGERNLTVYHAAQMLAAASWEHEDIFARIKAEGCTLSDDEINRAIKNGMEFIK